MERGGGGGGGGGGWIGKEEANKNQHGLQYRLEGNVWRSEEPTHGNCGSLPTVLHVFVDTI